MSCGRDVALCGVANTTVSVEVALGNECALVSGRTSTRGVYSSWSLEPSCGNNARVSCLLSMVGNSDRDGLQADKKWSMVAYMSNVCSMSLVVYRYLALEGLSRLDNNLIDRHVYSLCELRLNRSM